MTTVLMISNGILVHDNQNFSILGLGDTTNGSDRLVVDRVIIDPFDIDLASS